MNSFVARQPIFTKNMKVFGYELLYRDGAAGNAAGVEAGAVSGNTATSDTIINSFHHIGIQKLTDGKRAFVNFTEQLIVREVATLLPRDTLVIEVLEGIPPTPAILNALENMRKSGYMIALDDFIISPEYYPYLQYANIIKIDFLASTMGDIEAFSAELRRDKKILLAEKIENREIFYKAVEWASACFRDIFSAGRRRSAKSGWTRCASTA
jgi:c-di-GMP-related signal transduction protein